MDVRQFFLQRYTVLCDVYLAGVWQAVPEDLMRQRPHPRANSLAWNLWHVARVEDAGLNRFVADRAQVLDEGAFLQRLNVPWRHQGTGMTLAEVDDLDRRIDLPALPLITADACLARAFTPTTHDVRWLGDLPEPAS